MEYDKQIYAELAMELLEGDVQFISHRYWIPGYDQEDLAQELRLKLWQSLPRYNHDRAGFRAWANLIMRNHARDLLRMANRDKRGGKVQMVHLPDEIYNQFVICGSGLSFSDEELKRINVRLDGWNKVLVKMGQPPISLDEILADYF